MSLSPKPIPWQTPEEDPVFKQLADVCSWLASQAPAGRRKTTLSLPGSLQYAWHDFMSFERRAICEYVLEAWVNLIQRGELTDREWQELLFNSLARRVGKTQTDSEGKRLRLFVLGKRRLAQLQAGAEEVAAAFFPVGDPDRAGWARSFTADGRVTTIKMQRLGEPEFDHAVAELQAVPSQLRARCRILASSGLPASLALPTADALFLHAHDALQPASSRFTRFRTFISALVIVYKDADLARAHDPHAVMRLEAVRDSLASEQQAIAFDALPLELQVSAVDHARDLVFDACKREQTERELLASDRVVKLLEAAFGGHEPAGPPPADFVVSSPAYPFGVEAWRDEVVKEFHGGEHGLPVRSQTPRSLGKEAPSRFFPAARTGSGY